MTVDLVVVHDRALAATRRLVAGIGADQWHLPTPCDDWDVRTLVNHIVSGNYWVAELCSGRTIEEVGDALDGDILGDDHVATYDTSARLASAAFAAPGALDAPVAVSYGPVPGAVYAGHRFIDVLVHGWDLAVGTFQPTTLDPDLVAACIEVVEPQAELLAGSGAFGSEVEIAADASPQTRLLAMLGRRG
jgi:uncharacterized protein (TIGR03086 family)